MSKTGPILLIDDDPDDMEIFRSALKELNVPNELSWFNQTSKAMDHLKTMKGQPFIIICDMNLPKQNGIAFKMELEANEQLRKKCIPFLFYSTSVDKYVVNEAYANLVIQGFFKKEYSYDVIKDRIGSIVSYWMHCEHPSDL